MNYILFAIFAKVSLCSLNSDPQIIPSNSFILPEDSANTTSKSLSSTTQSFDLGFPDYLEPAHNPSWASAGVLNTFKPSAPKETDISVKESPKQNNMSLSFLLNDNQNSSTNNVSEAPLAVWMNQESKKSNQNEAVEPAPTSLANMSKKSIDRLPISLLAKTLKAVSSVMGKNSINVSAAGTLILKATFERFEEIFLLLDQQEESKFDIIISGAKIEKSHVKAALERISKQRPVFNGSQGNAKNVLRLITGWDCKSMITSECYKKLAELLVRHAMILYSVIPDAWFDEDGELCVKGQYFPSAEIVQAHNIRRPEKRKLEAIAAQPPAKKQRTYHLNGTSDSARCKRNICLFAALHNHIADRLKIKLFEGKPSVTTIVPNLLNSIVSIINFALNRQEGVINAEIHSKYPVCREFLKSVKSSLTETSIPSKKKTEWLLKAFQVPDVDSMNKIDVLYTLAQWYVAVAMAAVESIDNVKFVNGQVFVDGEPFRPHHEEQN